jgi:hypothetical protein
MSGHRVYIEAFGGSDNIKVRGIYTSRGIMHVHYITLTPHDIVRSGRRQELRQGRVRC